MKKFVNEKKKFINIVIIKYFNERLKSIIEMIKLTNEATDSESNHSENSSGSEEMKSSGEMLKFFEKIKSNIEWVQKIDSSDSSLLSCDESVESGQQSHRKKLKTN